MSHRSMQGKTQMHFDPDTKWTITRPGVMELPTTKFRIEYRPESARFQPFHVFWDDRLIPRGSHSTLEDAQIAARSHAADLFLIGIEI